MRIDFAFKAQDDRALAAYHFLGGIAIHPLGPGVEYRDEAVRVGGHDGHLGRPIQNAFQKGIRLGE